MNRSLKLSMLLALALGSAQAAALELGQVQVKSSLGQPLLAEIPLTPESPAELASLSARLASPEDFARAGIVGGRPPIALQFSLANADGGKVIRITSAVAINDPYLDLLVEVSTSAGKSVREFTILLDPPGSIASAPVSHAPTHATTSRPAAPTAAAPAPTPTRRAAVVSEGNYGPVERGQTLSGIARQATPSGVDANQMLLAFKQANPDAFYRDNINALKSGVVLRVPSREEAEAMSVAAAAAEVRRQNGVWRGDVAATPTTVAAAAAGQDTATAPSPADAGDRLALVPAKDGGSGAGAGGGNAKADRTLRQDLLRSQEALTTLQAQSGELKSRLKDLEDINGKNERLLSLKDNEIAELQRKLAEARRAAHLPAAPVAAATAGAPAAVELSGVKEGAVAGAASVGTSVVTAAGSASTAPATTASVPAVAGAAKPAPAKPAAKPVSRSTPATAEAPWYMQTWVWEAAGGTIVLLLLLALLARRRRPTASKTSTSSLADRFGALPATAAATSDDPDQDELLDQLAEHPDDVGLHLELVSLYYARRDVDHFEAAAEAMQAHVADPQQAEWQDVVAMGEDLVPGHPLFAGATAMESSQDAYTDEVGDHAEHAEFDERADDHAALDHIDEPDDLDSSMPAADDELPPAMPPLPQKKVSEYHFDFDLTPAERRGETPSVSAGDDAVVAPWANADAETAEPEPVAEAAPSWKFDAAEATYGGDSLQESDQFNGDPVDTKLDLARAYLDMGDAEGARAMLEEVMTEGSQMQKDAAGRLLESLH